MHLSLLLTSLAEDKNQSLADSALVMVSWVVKVLLATMNKVDSASHSFNTSAISEPSTLETNLHLRSRFE